jgi:hypothetical protein
MIVATSTLPLLCWTKEEIACEHTKPPRGSASPSTTPTTHANRGSFINVASGLGRSGAAMGTHPTALTSLLNCRISCYALISCLRLQLAQGSHKLFSREAGRTGGGCQPVHCRPVPGSMATRYYGSETRPGSGKRIMGPGAQASQCPFATSAVNTPYAGAGSQARARSPGPMQTRPSSARVPWAVDADRSGGRNTQGYIVPAKCVAFPRPVRHAPSSAPSGLTLDQPPPTRTGGCWQPAEWG